MDSGTPSHIYLTICLYISFYFLFFTNPPLPPPSQHRATGSDGQPYSSSSEDYFDRRAKSQSEQLDPFLAATRKATAIAKAQAKASVRNTIRNHSRQSSRQSSHSRQQSQHHHQRYSSGSQGNGILPSNKHSLHLGSFAHIRQKSNHNNTLNHPSYFGQATATTTSITTPPSTSTSSHTLTNPIFLDASYQKRPHKQWQGYPFTVVNSLRERKHRSPRSFHPRNHPHNHQNPHRYYQQQKQAQPYTKPGTSSFSLLSYTMQTSSIAQPMHPGALNTSPGVDRQEQVEEIKEIEELEQEEQQQQLQQQESTIHDPRPQHISITTERTTPRRSSSDNTNNHNTNTTRFPTGQGHSNGTSTLNTRTRYEPKCRLEGEDIIFLSLLLLFFGYYLS